MVPGDQNLEPAVKSLCRDSTKVHSFKTNLPYHPMLKTQHACCQSLELGTQPLQAAYGHSNIFGIEQNMLHGLKACKNSLHLKEPQTPKSVHDSEFSAYLPHGNQICTTSMIQLVCCNCRQGLEKKTLIKPVFKAAGLCLIIIGLCNTAWNPFHPQLRRTTNLVHQSSRKKRLTLDYRVESL